MVRVRLALLATIPLLCAGLAAAACGGDDSSSSSDTDAGSGVDASKTPPAPPPNPPPPPADGGADADAALPQQYLYVGNDNPDGGVFRYTLPLTDASAPDPLGHTDNVMGVGVAPNGDLVTGTLSGGLEVYHPPFTRDQAPAAAFANAGAANSGQIAFSADGGVLFAGTVSTFVNAFDAPFTDASTPSKVITDPDGGLNNVQGISVDGAGKLYAATTNRLFVFASPYSTPSVITPPVGGAQYRKMALTSTRLFVTSVQSNQNRVDVYDLPLTNASAPAFAISSGVGNPEAVAIDAAGNLYVGNLDNAMVTVYAPPFSAASAPVRTMQVATSGFALFSLAIAP